MRQSGPAWQPNLIDCCPWKGADVKWQRGKGKESRGDWNIVIKRMPHRIECKAHSSFPRRKLTQFLGSVHTYPEIEKCTRWISFCSPRTEIFSILQLKKLGRLHLKASSTISAPLLFRNPPLPAMNRNRLSWRHYGKNVSNAMEMIRYGPSNFHGLFYKKNLHTFEFCESLVRATGSGIDQGIKRTMALRPINFAVIS